MELNQHETMSSPVESALTTGRLEVLKRYAYRLARNKADADDLVQEACCKAHRAGLLDAPLCVLFTIIRNSFIDWRRKHGAIPFSTLSSGASGAWERDLPAAKGPVNDRRAATSVRETIRRRLDWAEVKQRLFEKLTEAERVVFHQYVLLNSFDQVAKVTGYSCQDVRRLVAAAKEILADYLTLQPH